MASAFSRVLRSDGFSYALRRFISRKTPSRCIFLFRALRACSTLLSRTNTCKCFPIVLLSLVVLDQGGSGFGFHLFAQTPELKSFYVDCFFDHIAGEVMGRGLVRPDHPRNSPGTVVLREFAPHRIAGEGA